MSTGRGAPDAAARRRLEQDLDRLRRRRAELTETLRGRDTVGDRGDSAEELELADELVRVEDQISDTVARLSGAVPAPAGEDTVPPGTEVTLRYRADGTEQTLRVVAAPEEIPAGAEDTAVTTHSPLGRALAGHRAGDVVAYPTPDGIEEADIVALRHPGDP